MGSPLLSISHTLSLCSYQVCGTVAQGLEKIDRTKFLPWMLSMIAPLIAQPASKGAFSMLYTATAPELTGRQFSLILSLTLRLRLFA